MVAVVVGRITSGRLGILRPGRTAGGSSSRTIVGSKPMSRRGLPVSNVPRSRSVDPFSRPVLPLNRGRFERRLRAVGVAGLPISGSRTYAGRDGPRGDPAGLVVLPPRLRREPDGGRLRRGDAHRFWPNPPGSRAGLRRRGDVAGAPGGGAWGGGFWVVFFAVPHTPPGASSPFGGGV